MISMQIRSPKIVFIIVILLLMSASFLLIACSIRHSEAPALTEDLNDTVSSQEDEHISEAIENVNDEDERRS